VSEPPLVRRSPVAARHCNLARSFELMGDRWTLLILRPALYGVQRFDDFQADLDIPRSVLSSRLAGLAATGIMERREYRMDGQRSRVEYALTEMGQSLALPFTAMTAWGGKGTGDGTTPLTLRSKTTGEKLSAALVDEGGRRVTGSDVEIVIDAAVARDTGEAD
jgi:DNA-binding HxlR family transcriptional regulator